MPNLMVRSSGSFDSNNESDWYRIAQNIIGVCSINGAVQDVVTAGVRDMLRKTSDVAWQNINGRSWMVYTGSWRRSATR